MAKRSDLSPEVQEVLWDQYCKAIKYQRLANDIRVTMTFDEFLSLWSKSRIATITSKLAISQKTLHAYLTGPFRPVCSWVSREAMVRGGTMTVQDAKIRTADESRKLFRFQAGDQHSPEAKSRIGASKAGKKQTPEQIAKRTAARVATMSRKRVERSDGKGCQN
jgi:hypothetical protein